MKYDRLDSAVIDLPRLERSLQLEAEPLGRGRYRVVGGRETHWVDLRSRAQPCCDCGDYLWREEVCKHILAALLREGNGEVLRAVGHLVSRLRTMARAA